MNSRDPIRTERRHHGAVGGEREREGESMGGKEGKARDGWRSKSSLLHAFGCRRGACLWSLLPKIEGVHFTRIQTSCECLFHSQHTSLIIYTCHVKRNHTKEPLCRLCWSLRRLVSQPDRFDTGARPCSTGVSIAAHLSRDGSSSLCPETPRQSM